MKVPLVLAAAALGAATALASAGHEPFATWYYVFAWAATLGIADSLIAFRTGSWFLFGRPAFTAGLFLTSVPFWLFFELVNLRIENWFYVFVPDARAVRWSGIVLSFSTVLPAILVSERLLDAFGLARRAGSRPFLVTAGLRAALQVAGLASVVLVLAWPRLFFPLVWIGPTLLADPFVHAREPARSLLGDLERGRPGRIARLLAGGLAIGLAWELYNEVARAGWIYTVPGFDRGKLFEMPLPGFLGFPVFALEGYATWQALVVAGLVTPREGLRRPAPAWGRLATAAGAAAFAVLALLAMERATIASTMPRPEELPGAPRAAAIGDWDVFTLARAEPLAVARAAGVPLEAAGRWIESARLASLEGLGAEGARRLQRVGVTTVAALAAADPAELARKLERAGEPAREARLRVWVRAARETIGR